jgi:DNA-binding PadR family transcriptional regulator
VAGNLNDMGRFAEPALLILTSLANGSKHGYSMIKDIERLSGTTLGPGTLYGALTRLEQDGYIASLPYENRRRPYRLTELGRTVLEKQLTNMQNFAVAGLARLEGAL